MGTGPFGLRLNIPALHLRFIEIIPGKASAREYFYTFKYT